MSKNLRDVIVFRYLNLMQEWPINPAGGVDFIFCRNVIIYFDRETQKILFDKFYSQLVPGGYLFIGHSETLHKVTDRFNLLGKTIYERVK